MKNKFFITVVAVLCSVFSFMSCADFLEEDNKVGSTADLSYSTPSGIQGLVSSCYTFARGFYGKEGGVGLTEGGTDLFYYGTDNKQVPLVDYSLTSASLDATNNANPVLDHYWELFYCAVDACNNALKYVPLNTKISEKDKNIYMGEAFFLKAFYNFHIVNIWGDAPYNDAAIENPASEPVREPEATIYGKIIEDLKSSIVAFEAADYKVKTDGRANYWAARALLARVYLYKASWLEEDAASYQLAQTEAEAVIAGSGADFYSTFSETWNMENEDLTKNKEAIFGIAYSSDLKTAVNCIPYRYRTDNDGVALSYNEIITRTGYSRGGSAMLLMYVSLWNNGCPDIKGDIFVRVTTAANSILNGVDISWYSRYGRGFTRYLPSLYLWQTLEKYRETDQRTDATLLTTYNIVAGLEGKSGAYPQMTDTAIYYSALNGDSPEGIALQQWAKNKYRLQFAYGGEIPVYTSGDPKDAVPTSAAVPVSATYGDARYNDPKIGGKSSYPGIRKFLDWYDDQAADPTYLTHDISSRDAVVIRLAEMYLIKAECQLKTGGDALATLNALRSVRAIAGKDNSRTGTVDIGTILEERAIELCGEQHRWFDLKRTHKLVELVQDRNAQVKNIEGFHNYRPIPQAQIDACTNVVPYPGAAGKFWQNDGY